MGTLSAPSLSVLGKYAESGSSLLAGARSVMLLTACRGSAMRAILAHRLSKARIIFEEGLARADCVSFRATFYFTNYKWTELSKFRNERTNDQVQVRP